MSRTKFSLFRYDADNTPLPEGTRCVSVFLPDDDAYVRLLAGLLTTLNKATNWEGEQDNRDSRAYACETAFQLNEWDGCMDCSEVQDCIENDGGVKDALAANQLYNIENNTDIQDALNKNYNPAGVGNPIPASIGDTPFPTVTDCDPDATCGAVTYVVRELDRQVTDFCEKLSEQDNAAARVAVYISAIPGVNELPIDEAFQWFDDTIDTLYTAYAAAYDEAYEDEVRCALLCIAQENDCTLTFNQIYDYWYGRLNFDPSTIFAEIVGFLIAGTWTGSEVADVFIFLNLLSLKFHNQFMATHGSNALGVQWMAGMADPDVTCAEVCDDCPEDTFILLFDSPINFGGTQQSSQVFTPGEEMVFVAVNPYAGRYGVCLYAPNGDYNQTFTISSGTPTAPGTEIVWLYTDLSDMTQLATGATDTAADFPTPVDVRMEQGSNLKCTWWWSASPFTVNVTLT